MTIAITIIGPWHRPDGNAPGGQNTAGLRLLRGLQGTRSRRVREGYEARYLQNKKLGRVGMVETWPRSRSSLEAYRGIHSIPVLLESEKYPMSKSLTEPHRSESTLHQSAQGFGIRSRLSWKAVRVTFSNDSATPTPLGQSSGGRPRGVLAVFWQFWAPLWCHSHGAKRSKTPQAAQNVLAFGAGSAHRPVIAAEWNPLRHSPSFYCAVLPAARRRHSSWSIHSISSRFPHSTSRLFLPHSLLAHRGITSVPPLVLGVTFVCTCH